METTQDTPVGLLGDLLPTYQLLVKELNRVRQMIWAWDYARARETLAALRGEFSTVLIRARDAADGLTNASRSTPPQRRLRGLEPPDDRLRESGGEEDGETVESSSYNNLLDGRQHALPASIVPSFALSGIEAEIERLERRLDDLPDAEAETVPAGGYLYRFTPRPEGRFEIRAYRDHPLEQPEEDVLERLRAVTDRVLAVRPDGDERAVLYRLVLGPALLDLRLLSPTALQATFYALEQDATPPLYLSDIFALLGDR